MVVNKLIENSFGSYYVIYRPFMLPRPVIDEKRLISDVEYEGLIQSGKLIRNKIDPRYL